MPYSQFVVDKRPRRRLHWLRAIWRDSLALVREFRRSISLFLVVIFVGGFIYGERYHAIEGDYIDPIDRPYVMIQLMILETPANQEPPTDLVLIAFWYALPPILIFIIGSGAADFVRLFFNRNERRDAWREAVASTYNHHVIVFGAGHVGLRVIRVLVQMGMDVVALDNDPDTGVEDALNELNVPLILADGRLPATLEKAGLRQAEAFVACTGQDHVNLDAIMRVRDMNPEIRIVSRVWDDQFTGQIERFMNVQSVLSSSDLAAPIFAASAMGIEITQTLKVNGTHYSMLRLTVNEGSFMDGREIGDLQQENDMDIVLYGTGEDARVQPSRQTVVRAGDTLVIFAEHGRILDIVSRNRRKKKSSR